MFVCQLGPRALLPAPMLQANGCQVSRAFNSQVLRRVGWLNLQRRSEDVFLLDEVKTRRLPVIR